MTRNLFPHRCENCGNSYLSPDKDRVFCASDCEVRFKSKGRANKVLILSEEERREKATEAYNRVKEKDKFKTEAEQKKKTKKLSLNHIMYKNTFKPHVPKSLRVMRG